MGGCHASRDFPTLWVSSGCSQPVVLPGHPWLWCQPVAPGPSGRHTLWCLCSPPFLPAMLPWPEETSVTGKAPPVLRAPLCMAAPCMSAALAWCLGGRRARVAVAWLCWCSVSGGRHGAFARPCVALRARPHQHPVLGGRLQAAGTRSRGVSGWQQCWHLPAVPTGHMAQVGRRSYSFRQDREQEGACCFGGVNKRAPLGLQGSSSPCSAVD